jgi:gamma-glutamyltranspeptidase/glutathione hydrolase
MRTSSTALRLIFAAALLAGTISGPAFADSKAPGRDQARSMAVTQYGIVATSQAAASQAGVAILEKGGNAIDAAIAANAALAVIEPMMNGIGGDLFAIVYIAKTHQYIGINASGWTPAGLSLAVYKAKGFTKLRPIDQVTVPGMVAGWDMLAKRFGKLGLAHDLGPAIALAEQGVGIAETNAEAWAIYSKAHAGAPGFAATFLPGGKPPATGDLFRNPALGRSLRRIAAHGRDGFYKGPTADAILAMERRLGGFMTADDLVSFTPEWIQPVSTTYHGWTVFELPPNGQGLAALSMLNMMERFPIAEWGHNSARALHVEIEAKKLAYADLQHFVGDPRATPIPTEALISKALARDRAATIGERAACHVLPSNIREALSRQSSDTTYLSVVDKDGNEVSLIQSNSGAFGTGITPDGLGFPLHNRGAGFQLEDGHPNTLRPRMRPLHTIIPGFMEKGDRHIGFGIMGGFNQAQAHAQFVSNIVDFGMNLQGALEAARFTKLDFEGCGVMIENGVDPAVVAALRAQGHEVEVMARFYQQMGRGNAVETRDGKPVHYGATDPRTDGEAIPEQPPFQ